MQVPLFVFVFRFHPAQESGKDPGTVIANMMEYTKQEFGARPSYIGPGGLSDAEVPLMQFRAERAKQIAAQKTVMQQMVKEVAERRTRLFHEETIHSPRPGSAASTGRAVDSKPDVDNQDDTDNDGTDQDEDHVAHLPLSDWLFAVSSGAVRVETSEGVPGVTTPKSLSQLDDELKAADSVAKFGNDHDTIFGHRRSNSFVARSKRAVAKSKMMRVGILARARERLESSIEAVKGMPGDTPEDVHGQADRLLGAIVKAESKKLLRDQPPLSTALIELLKLYIRRWSLLRQNLKDSCSTSRAILNTQPARSKAERLERNKLISDTRAQLNKLVVEVKAADAKARAHSETLRASQIATDDISAELFNTSLSLTDEAQRLVAQFDQHILLEEQMQSREQLHALVEQALTNGTLTFAGWSQTAEDEVQAAIANAVKHDIDDKHEFMLRATLVLAAMRTLRGLHHLQGVVNEVETTRDAKALQSALTAVANLDDVLLQSCHEFDMDVKLSPTSTPGHSRSGSLSDAAVRSLKDDVLAYKKDAEVVTLRKRANNALSQLRLREMEASLER